MWRRVAVELDKRPVDLLVLPELAGVDSFWSSPTFDETVWRRAAATHATLDEHLRRIALEAAGNDELRVSVKCRGACHRAVLLDFYHAQTVTGTNASAHSE